MAIERSTPCTPVDSRIFDPTNFQDNPFTLRDGVLSLDMANMVATVSRLAQTKLLEHGMVKIRPIAAAILQRKHCKKSEVKINYAESLGSIKIILNITW